MEERAERFRSALRRIIEVVDKPLLGAALVAVGLYLLELRGFLAATPVAGIVSAILDSIFLADFALKVGVLRTEYLRSPWVVIDALSCLPGLALFANASWITAVQITRLLRVMRVLRSVRLLRTLELMPAVIRMAKERDQEGRRFTV